MPQETAKGGYFAAPNLKHQGGCRSAMAAEYIAIFCGIKRAAEKDWDFDGISTCWHLYVSLVLKLRPCWTNRTKIFQECL